MFTEHHMLLRNLARNRDVDDSTVKSAASFMCNVTDDGSCIGARAILFSRYRSRKALPSTSDATQWHIRRAEFQAMIWKLETMV